MRRGTKAAWSGDPTLSGPPAMLVHDRVGGHEADMRPSALLYFFV